MDCHTHCCHSHDTTVDPRLMIDKALEVGFKYIAFTDHSDKDYLHVRPEYGVMRQLDVQSHIDEILALREEYKDRIYIALGMECSYHQDEVDSYKSDIAKTDEWDIILNSVHTVNGHDIYYPSYYGDAPKIDKYREYLMTVYKSVVADFDYDVVAHLGYCSRKAIYGDNYLHYKDYSELIDFILEEIINRGASLELNTHAKFTGSEFLPHMEVIERYIEIGGRDFTFGSDAHQPIRVGDKYDVVKDFLLAHNIKYLNIYKHRQAIKIPLA